MSRFPTKTMNELRVYFLNLSLEALTEINHSYGPHFEKLEIEKEEIQNSIQEKRQALQSMQSRIEREAKNLSEVERLQKTYESDIQSIREDNSGAELHLALQARGPAPMSSYSYQQSSNHHQLTTLSSELAQLTRLQEKLDNKFSRAVSELRLLNSCIEMKKAAAAAAVPVDNQSFSLNMK